MRILSHIIMFNFLFLLTVSKVLLIVIFFTIEVTVIFLVIYFKKYFNKIEAN
jgi:hypothetical protein